MEDILKTLNEVCSFKSVAERTGDPAMPYGEEVGKAFAYMLEKGESFGLKAVNRDNQVGWLEMGEGDEIVAVLCHLDVVPAGKGWDCEPYAATVKDGRIYGRGVSDNKGPAVMVMYAMKEILESGAPLKRRVRLIFGQTEESGAWSDMAYYREHEELPVMGFTPDADFPAIHGEKGLCHINLSMNAAESGILAAEAGQAPNVVPNEAYAKLVIGGEEKEFSAKGVSAHASLPENGRNAVSELMAQIGKATEGCAFANFYNSCIGFDLHGERIGASFEDDKSGKLTLNAGVLKLSGGDVVLTIDIRFPVSYTVSEVFEAVRAKVSEFGVKAELIEQNEPMYSDKNGPLITKLLKVYHELTGLGGESEVIGGGTYAKAMDNIVAFGPMIPGRELTEHQANEYMLLDDFMMIKDIYKQAILELAQ